MTAACKKAAIRVQKKTEIEYLENPGSVHEKAAYESE
jgi:hypothetical protein